MNEITNDLTREISNDKAKPIDQAVSSKVLSGFEAWWYNEASAWVPLPNEDYEEHARRIAKAAWDRSHNEKFAPEN